MIHLGVLFSRVRVEEKWLFEALEKRGLNYSRLDDRVIKFDITNPGTWAEFEAVFIRSMSYARGLYAAKILNSWGIPTVNTGKAAEICGDKLATATVLGAAGIPQPKILTAFSYEAALEAIEEIGYPVVLKPVVGSWGRLLAKINDREAAEAILEHKTTLGSYQHSIFFIQEYINKPGRDIRAIVIGNQTVCAFYRSSDHWVTNAARGGKGSICQVTPELNELCVQAAQAVGGGVFGVDIIEDPERGYLVNEVNHTLEFQTAVNTTGVDVPGLLVDYLVAVAKNKPEAVR